MALNTRQMVHPQVLQDSYIQGAESEETPILDLLWTGAKPVDEDEVQVDYDPEERRPAPLNKRGAPARVLSMDGATKRAGALFHAFNELPLSNNVIRGMRSDDQGFVRKAADELSTQTQKFGKRHVIGKQLALAKTIVDGEVIVSPTGEIKESSEAGDVTLTFGVSASHQGNCGGLLALPWDNPAAKIWNQFEAFDQQARRENVPPPKLVLANSNVKEHIRENTEFLALRNNSEEAVDAALRGEDVEGLFGRTWKFIDTMYKGADGEYHYLIPDGKAVFLPAVNNGWLRLLEGLEQVPTRIELARNIDELLASLQDVYGPFAYAAIQHNPVLAKLFMGDNYGWVFAEPNAIWQVDIYTP